MDSRFSNLTVIERSGRSFLSGKQPMKSKSRLFKVINPVSEPLGRRNRNFSPPREIRCILTKKDEISNLEGRESENPGKIGLA
jgi:hypothetical protein